MPAQPIAAPDEALDTAAISLALRSARETNTALSRFPGPLPTSLDGAYAIQDASIDAWPDEIVGWKVGGVPKSFQTVFPSERLAGPIFRKTLRHAAFDEGLAAPAYRGGFVAIEAEWALQLGDTSRFDPAAATAEDVARVIRAAHAGVEIASSPMPMINELGPAAVISDFGNNFGLVVGPALEAWTPAALEAVSVSVAINGDELGRARAATGLDGPLGAVRFLIANLRERGIMDLEGLWISTGAITGVHDTAIGARSVVTFGGLGAFHIDVVEIEAAPDA